MPERIPRSLFAALCFAATLLAENSYAANAPTNLRVASSLSTGTNSYYELTWEDNSNDEDNFQILVSTSPGVPFATVSTIRKNQTLASIFLNDRDPVSPMDFDGVTLYFSVRALSSASGNSAFSNEESIAAPPPGVSLNRGSFHSATRDIPISTYIPDTTGAITMFSATGLPPGLNLDTSSGAITGTPMATGLFRPRIAATDGVSTISTFVTFRIIANPGAPALDAPLPDYQVLANAAPMQIDLRPRFSDPDTTSAVRIATNRGPIDAIIYEEATPASTENFFTYVNRGDYTGNVFHRSVSSTPGAPNFAGVDVIQAGWFKPGGGGDYVTFPLDPAVRNEPGISNVRGTIAMAKQSGSSNSGTSQWYFNVTDNLNLDPITQNGGFTVFGRATTPSLAKMDEIYALPFADYSITLDGGARLISDWPTNQVPAGSTPAPADLVQIFSVTTNTTFLTYAVTSNTDPAIATATVTGGHTLEIAPASLSARGESTITVTATDLDGNVTMDSFLATVKQNYNVWSLSKTFPGNLSGPLDDGERDTLNNTLEYAFEGDINQADSGPISPDLSTRDVPGGSDHLAITFTHLKFADDLSYQVQRNTGAGWVTVWETADGFAHPNVFEAIEGSSSCRLTVIDPDPLSTFTASVLRVAVALLPTGS